MRMSMERFEHLFSLVEDRITKQDTRSRKALSPRKRLVVTLGYLAIGCSQQTLCYSFRIGRTTVSHIIKDVCDVCLRPPRSEEDEWQKTSDDFEELWDLPHVIGAIDEKHIAIDCPKDSGSQY